MIRKLPYFNTTSSKWLCELCGWMWYTTWDGLDYSKKCPICGEG